MKKFELFAKKVLGVGLSAAMLATTMFTGGVASAEETMNLPIPSEAVTGNATYIGTYMKSDYLGGGRAGFEISFKYDSLAAPAEDNALGYNDTFEFLVFDSGWGGWDRTTVGPSGVDAKTDVVNPEADKENQTKPELNKVYTVNVPFSTIEGKLSTGGQVNGINLQTGGIGDTKVTITSLKYYTEAELPSTDVLIEGAWHKVGEGTGDCGTMTVKSGTAFVSANDWNISVSGFSVKDFKKPIVAVTVNYEGITEKIYPQSEILDSNYDPIEPNYPEVTADGDVTYLTPIPQDMTSMILAYDTCTVKTVEIYDEAEDFAKPITDLTNANITSNMGAGWNLGNALDAIRVEEVEGNKVATPDETAWGNPEINKRLFKQVAAAGIKTVRIPVTWVSAVDLSKDGSKIVTDEYNRIVKRVKEVVDMAIDYNMFVIINIQHDGGENVEGKWLDVTSNNQADIQAAFGELWEKIATKFEGYDQHLIFESMNEVMESGNYGAPSDTTWNNINALNQLFVNKVRGVGGENATRFLLMPGYNTDITQTVNGYNNGKFKLPTYNGKKDYEMVSVHFYDPYQFTLEQNGTSVLPEDTEDNIMEKFDLLETTFVNKGIPVFIGEFSAINKGNYSQISDYTTYVVQNAKEFHLGYAYWDNGYTGEYGTALWNRYTYAQTKLGNDLIPIL